LYGVFVQYVSTYYPENNGQVENRNREIVKYIRLLGDQEKDWDEVLLTALWALRTCKNEVTKFSSFELLYGRTDLQPFELSINFINKKRFESQDEYLIRKFITHQKWIIEATKNIKNANYGRIDVNNLTLWKHNLNQEI